MGKQTRTKSKSKAKPLVLFTLIIVALMVLLFVITKMQEEKSKQPVRFSEQLSLENQPILGNENAPVTVVEFGDYKCPSCKAWGERVFPQFKQDYIDTGKVKFAYINVLFHGAESQLASLAAESVFTQNPEAFWAYHKAVFDAQPTEDHDALWVTQEKLLDIAKTHVPQIDLSKLEDDINNQKGLSELDIDTALVEKYKVQFTPTIMINGIVLDDPFDYNKTKEIIEQELGAIK